MTARRAGDGRWLVPVLLATALAVCGAAPPASPPAPIAVRVVPVRRGAIDEVLSVSGQTAGLRVVRLADAACRSLSRGGQAIELGEVGAAAA